MANFNINRGIGKIKVKDYQERLKNGEIFKLYYNKKYKSFKLSDILEMTKNQKEKDRCFLCNDYLLQCSSKNLNGLEKIIHHINKLEKSTNKYIFYPASDNKRSTLNSDKKRFQNTKFEMVTFHPTMEEMKDFIGYVESLNEFGIRYGAVKIIPPNGKNQFYLGKP